MSVSPEFAWKVEYPSEIDHMSCDWNKTSVENDLTVYFHELYADCLSNFEFVSIHRIYYGSEFCEFRIPTASALEQVLRKAECHRLPVTFLTPPVTEYGIQKITALLPLLQEYSCEISVNDYGVLQLLKEKHYTGEIICGRILDKLYHDGRMNRKMFADYTNSFGYEYLRSPGIAAASFQELLQENGIHRADMDLPLYGLELPEASADFAYSVFLPYGYVTTGRICMMRNFKQGGYAGYDLSKKSCAQACRQYDQMMVQPVGNVQLNSNQFRERNITFMRKGNTMFYGVREIEPKELRQFQRVILQGKLML